MVCGIEQTQTVGTQEPSSAALAQADHLVFQGKSRGTGFLETGGDHDDASCLFADRLFDGGNDGALRHSDNNLVQVALALEEAGEDGQTQQGPPCRVDGEYFPGEPAFYQVGENIMTYFARCFRRAGDGDAFRGKKMF